MGVGYKLVNIDKKQQIGFYNVDTGTKLSELTRNVIASTIVTYYLLTNTGDKIGFINDTEYSFIVCGQTYQSEYFTDFVDATDKIIEELLEMKIIQDNGITWVDKEDNLFNRNLTLI